MQKRTTAKAKVPPTGEWIWNGYLAPGKITLLSSRRSSGKTTLLSILLAMLKTGGELAGAAVKPARAYILASESHDDWMQRIRRFRYPASMHWCLNAYFGFGGLPKWHGIIDEACADEFELLVIDPLSMIISHGIRHTDESILATLQPLRRVTDRGAAVLVLNLAPGRSPMHDYLRPVRKALLTDFADIAMNWDRHGRSAHPAGCGSSA
jgi:hypothetical protein